MTFQHIAAPIGSRVDAVLPACSDRPDRFTLIDTIRRASEALGLKAPVIATLDVLLSCLAPKRTHDFVFASNATLAFKRNGISDRTLRRHIAHLAEAGFLIRTDSPNRKRFTKNDMATGRVLRFGFDLSPLFALFDRLRVMADECARLASHIAYLRTKLRCAIARTLLQDGQSTVAEEAQRALRRKLTARELESMLGHLVAVVDDVAPCPEEDSAVPAKMTAADGQNDRHHQNSNKEPLDSDTAKTLTNSSAKRQPLSLRSLVEACPEAASYLPRNADGPADVVGHAKTLAPMMGIDRTAYHAAEERLGELGAAVTVWGLLQLQGKIRQFGAYFRALTTGKRSASFDPWALISSLGKQGALAAA